jgi:MYXO-CTERM domain-containing protein
MRRTVTAYLCGGLALLVLGVLLARRRRARDRSPAAARSAFLRAFAAELGRTHSGTARVVGFVPCSFTVVLRLDGQDTAIPLHRLAQRAQVFPDALPRLVQQLVDEARAGMLDRVDALAFAGAATRLVPQLQTEARLAELGPRFGDEALPSMSLGADLVAVLAIARGDHLTFVNHGLLREWGRDFAGLMQLAIDNLRRRTRVDLESIAPTDAVVIDSGDSLDAARVLLLDSMRARDAHFAVPERDLLWVGGAAAGTERELERSVAKHFAAAQHPLSPRIYRMVRGRIEFADAEGARSDQRGVPRMVRGAAVGASTSMLEPSLGSKPKNLSR